MLIIRNGSNVEPLQYYKELAVKTRVNGERSLSFILLSTDASYNLVETDSIIEYNTQQYRIIKTNERSKGEHSVKSVQCLHILFDLIDNDVTGVLNGSQTLNQVMSFILSGTSYTFDIVDSFSSVTLEDWGDDNSLALFQNALNLFDAEFDVNNTHITLKAQIGDITDFQFRYRHNIKTIEKSIEKVGSEVKLSIKLTFADLKKAGYPYEVVNCGDTVFTIYDPMNINVTNRIVEYTEYPLEPKESTVTLANFQDNITDIMADFGNTQKRFNKVVDSNDKIKFNVLDDATQRATTALNNALTELEFPEGLGIIARDPNDANRFVVLRSNGIGITTDGGQTFKDAITADGFVLSAGAIGQLSANNITIGGETSFASGYDPTTKETPTGAQTKANGAESSAKTHADSVASAAETNAKTHADTVSATAESNAKTYADNNYSGTKTLVEGWKYPNTTYINGGNIYTNSITANQIASKTITANEIATNTITSDKLISNIVLGTNAKFTGTVEGATIKTSNFESLVGDVIYFGDKTNPKAIIDTATDSARFQLNSTNYIKIGPGNTNFYVNGSTYTGSKFSIGENIHALYFKDTTSYFRFMYDGDMQHLLMTGAQNGLKFLDSTDGVQVRNTVDTTYRPIMASEFVTSSRLAEKKNIVAYSESALEKIINTQVYEYHRLDDNDLELKRVGFMYEYSPPEIVAPNGEGLLDYAIGAMAWKAIQELKAEIDVLKAEIESLKNGTV